MDLQDCEEVEAHSAFVAARSTILRARLLESEVNESGYRTVSMPDTSVQAFKFLLSYIYCDEIHPTRNGMNPSRFFSFYWLSASGGELWGGCRVPKFALCGLHWGYEQS